jgi:myo-inositol 2-dehydrogenase/D-chiro-inositol 1-dehydrogenase
MPQTIDRRAFVGAAAFTIVRPELVRGSQRNSAVRIGLLGCGGRGSGVASGFTSDTQAQYTVLADLFQEQTERAQQAINSAGQKAKKAPVGTLLHGPDCVEKIAASREIDAIHIATPPYFHPAHFEAAVGSGKHVYLEKPVSVDVPGAHRVQRAGEKAGPRQSIAVGFQLRHATPYVQLVQRARKGALGEIVCGLSHYYAGPIERPSWPEATPQQRRLRNWIHDKVLSGDILVEQNIHLVDVNNWVLRALPVSAQGTHGRKGRRDKGDCSSHFNVTYTYPGGANVTLTSTQFLHGEWDVAMRYFGTGGNAEMSYTSPVRITGPNKWDFPIGAAAAATGNAANLAGSFSGALDDADARKQQNFIDSIVSAKPINEARQGAESTLSAILGRQAAYTGRPWTWAEIVKLDEVWDAKLNVSRL